MRNKDCLFTFAVITDSHIKPGDSDESSAYHVNQMASGRSRYLVKLVNSYSPDFVIHLGDLVHPVPTLPTYDAAMNMAKSIFSELCCDVYPVAGNHDIGDKPLSWMPGPKVTEDNVLKYQQFWGESYYSFDRNDVHFVVTNSSIWNSGFTLENMQWEWLENDLKQHRSKRIILFTHYPLFVHNENEEEHYDNIGEPARSRLMALIKEYKVEAVYAGHVHHFFYNEQDRTKHYIVTSTSFFRPDYTEMFQVEPAPGTEGGRNDRSKFGFFLVDVYNDGHVNRFVPTYGINDEEVQKLPDKIDSISCARSKRHHRIADQVGVYLRHSWASTLQLPYGNVDEFVRKPVRNDYYLLALQRLGIRNLRVPASDCLELSINERMRQIALLGHQFTIHSVGVPGEKLIESMLEHTNLIVAWEWVLGPDQIEEALSSLKMIRKRLPMKIIFSVFETSADLEREGSRFNHFVRHGFQLQDVERLKEKMMLLEFSPDGIVFRLDPYDDGFKTILELNRLSNEVPFDILLHVQMQGSDDPSYCHQDDIQIASRLALLVATAFSYDGKIKLFFDTFMDHDRGYYIRNGLLDRRGNPRQAFDVLANMTALIEQYFGYFEIERLETNATCMTFLLKSNRKRAMLLLPEKDRSDNDCSIDLEHIISILGDNAEGWNLHSGEKHELTRNITDPTMVIGTSL